jgi:hypothetical protein
MGIQIGLIIIPAALAFLRRLLRASKFEQSNELSQKFDLVSTGSSTKEYSLPLKNVL